MKVDLLKSCCDGHPSAFAAFAASTKFEQRKLIRVNTTSANTDKYHVENTSFIQFQTCAYVALQKHAAQFSARNLPCRQTKWGVRVDQIPDGFILAAPNARGSHQIDNPSASLAPHTTWNPEWLYFVVQYIRRRRSLRSSWGPQSIIRIP